MSGHNKWSKLKHTKGKTDAARSNVFTKIARELSMIAKQGGNDPNINGRLRDAIAKARKANMSNDLVNRAINKASADTSTFEEIMYEGYGLHGVAVLVGCLTDNKNRTAGDVRHLFDKHGAGMGTANSAIFMFEHIGEVFIKPSNDVNEDDIMMAAMDAGLINMEAAEDGFVLTCNISDLSKLVSAVEKYGETDGEIVYSPTSTIKLNEEQYAQIEKLQDALDELDDVQNVWHNADLF